MITWLKDADGNECSVEYFGGCLCGGFGMSAHTPGPWEVDVRGREGNENDPWHCAIIGTAIGRHVVIADTLNCSCVFSPDDQRANARLIAAAPDMLVALKGLLFHFGNPRGKCRDCPWSMYGTQEKVQSRASTHDLEWVPVESTDKQQQGG